MEYTRTYRSAVPRGTASGWRNSQSGCQSDWLDASAECFTNFTSTSHALFVSFIGCYEPLILNSHGDDQVAPIPWSPQLRGE